MISIKHKLILTHPPKCAGTSVRTIFRDLDILDLDEGFFGARLTVALVIKEVEAQTDQKIESTWQLKAN